MLKWVFGADTRPYRSALEQMRSQTKSFAGSISGMVSGMFGGAVIGSWIASTIEAAGRIEDLSKRLDMSADSFQRLSHAALMSGGNIEVIGKGLTFLTRNLYEASQNADKFSGVASALNIDLEALAKMSPEQQMIELARGYAESTDKGAALSGIMKLLGKSGAEIIPMLTGGPEALTQMLGEASVATNKQIEDMAKLGDAMDALKNKSVAALGDMIDGFKIWAAYAEYALNRVFGKKEGAENQLDSRMDEIMNGGGRKSGAPKIDRESAKEVEEAAKNRLKITEEIARLEEESRQRSLNLAEKILDAEKRRAELAADSIFGEDEDKALEARKAQLEIEKELVGLRKEQSNNDDDFKKQQEENRNRAKEAVQREADAKRNNKFAGMDDQGKIAMLKAEQKKLQAEADKLLADGSDTTIAAGYDKRAEAEGKQGEIEALQRGFASDAKSRLDSLTSRGPTIATSSLADIGGGGGAAMLEMDYGKKQVDLLAIIAANTSNGSTGSKQPEPI